MAKPKDLLHGKLKNGVWVKEKVPTSKYPWAVKCAVAGDVGYYVAFSTKKQAQDTAAFMRRMRDAGTQTKKPNTVRVIRRSRKK